MGYKLQVTSYKPVSLANFIEKIQQKPRYIRTQILWVLVVICMAIIISLWLIFLKHSLSLQVEKPEVTKEISQSVEKIKKEIPSLKETLKASLGAFFEEKPENKEESEKKKEDIKTKQENIEPSIESSDEEKEVKPAKLPLSE